MTTRPRIAPRLLGVEELESRNPASTALDLLPAGGLARDRRGASFNSSYEWVSV
ncbi:MAG: hypothetical protein K2P78_02875 [Gemmataceae bacterium]|nr:hypothetical protein [Gemmataceae bacterium]